VAAEGRGWKYCGCVNSWPIRLEPTGRPSTVMMLPFACRWNTSCPTPKTANGYITAVISSNITVTVSRGRTSGRICSHVCCMCCSFSGQVQGPDNDVDELDTNERG